MFLSNKNTKMMKKHLKKLNQIILTTKNKKPKEANCIVVDGMSASGKSTLVNEIAKVFKFIPIFELTNNKKDLTNILLEKMYRRNEVAEGVCQLHFLLDRFSKYKKNNCISTNKIKVFDRSIFADRLFAYANLIAQPNVFNYYEKLWLDKVNELVYSIGLPKLYIILRIDWQTFKKRIFKRNRKMEIENFTENKDYFYFLLLIYEKYLIQICQTYTIPYVIIDSKKNLKEKIKEIKKIFTQYKINY